MVNEVDKSARYIPKYSKEDIELLLRDVPKIDWKTMADAIGDFIVFYIPPEKRLKGLNLKEMKKLFELLGEEIRWCEIEDTYWWEDRTIAIEELSNEDRRIVLLQENRERLLSGLKIAEQSQLLEWIENKEREER